MHVEETAIPEVLLITPDVHGDARGFFSETYNAQQLRDHGVDLNFVQDNHSFSAEIGILRGLHFQLPPFAQDKLVRVSRGRILDVAVDLRKNAPTFGQHVTAQLSRESWTQILVPAGFAHGFVTLEPNTEVIYKATNHYAPDHDKGIDYADPQLGIEWPLDAGAITVSEKDARQPSFADFCTSNPF